MVVKGGEGLVDRREVLAFGEMEAWVRGASTPKIVQRTKAIRIVQMQ